MYDITNRWSFDGIDRWIKEIDEVSEWRNMCNDLEQRHGEVSPKMLPDMGTGAALLWRGLDGSAVMELSNKCLPSTSV